MIEEAVLGSAHIAWALAVDDSDLRDAVRALGPSAKARHDGMDAARGRRFATGRRLLTALVARSTAGAVRIESVCDRCGRDHGRPRVEGAPFAVSISYAGDMVAAVAVALDSASAVGIDIERRTSVDDDPLSGLAHLFAPRTPPGLREWTEIEAAVKADGRGLRIPPADVAFGERCAMLLPGGRVVHVPGRHERVEVAPAPGPPDHVVSVAVVAAVNEAAPEAAPHPARRGRVRRAAPR
jgi:4'-phosphopantetheinyl transferase